MWKKIVVVPESVGNRIESGSKVDITWGQDRVASSYIMDKGQYSK